VIKSNEKPGTRNLTSYEHQLSNYSLTENQWACAAC